MHRTVPKVQGRTAAQGLEVDLAPGQGRRNVSEPGGLRPSPYSVFLHESCRYPYTREDSHEERLNWETRLVSTGDGPWRWVGGVFFNRYDSHGTSFEYAPGLSAFSGVTPILSGRPVSEPVEYHSLGVQAVEERPTRPCSATTSR